MDESKYEAKALEHIENYGLGQKQMESIFPKIIELNNNEKILMAQIKFLMTRNSVMYQKLEEIASDGYNTSGSLIAQTFLESIAEKRSRKKTKK